MSTAKLQNYQHKKSMVNLEMYVTLFPQLIAGPIVRYETGSRRNRKNRKRKLLVK